MPLVSSRGIGSKTVETRLAGPFEDLSLFVSPCALGRVTRSHQSLALHELLKFGIGPCLAGLALPQGPETIAHFGRSCESVGYQREYCWCIAVIAARSNIWMH